jgi:hypothetical protein
MILAGDIGGTNTRLAYFADTAEPGSMQSMKVYASRHLSSLASIVDDFMSGERPPIARRRSVWRDRCATADPRSRTCRGPSMRIDSRRCSASSVSASTDRNPCIAR